MATMTSGFCTTLLPRPGVLGGESLMWTVWTPGFFFTETGAQHNGERIWDPQRSYKSFAASTYVIGGMEAKKLGGVPAGADNYWFSFKKADGTELWSLRCSSDGHLHFFRGAAEHAFTTGTAPISDGVSTYYTVECAIANTATASVETRIGGIRVPQMTTTDWGAAGGQPAGTMTPPTATDPGAVLDRIELANLASGQYPQIYWYYQKNGSSLWTTVTTAGGTFAVKSDFVGPSKRIWLRPTAAGTYPLAGGNFWANGAGTYPTSIDDQAAGGMDSDGSYIKNATAGTGAVNDKVSHLYTLLPDTATTINFVQRSVIARAESAGTDVIRAGVRSPANATPPNNDNMGSDETLSSAYGIGVTGTGVTYYPAATWDATVVWTPSFIGTPASVAINAGNRFQGINEQRALT